MIQEAMQFLKITKYFIFYLFLVFHNKVLAEEGMWLLDEPVPKALSSTYKFDKTPDWAEEVRLSSLHLDNGCSASFVSPQGLVLTNYHCVMNCISALLSQDTKNMWSDGFYAANAQAEKVCPGMMLEQLLSTTDVTSSIRKATQNISQDSQEYQKAIKIEYEKLKNSCKTSPLTHCEVIDLYGGAVYHLYKYQQYQDVRLVFAPEYEIALFGEELDNFEFPRHNLDVAFLRVYQNNQPLLSSHYFKWSAHGPKSDELLFTSGYPSISERFLTYDYLLFFEKFLYPLKNQILSERKVLLSHLRDQHQSAKGFNLLNIDNRLKPIKAFQSILSEEHFLEEKLKQQQRFIEQVKKSSSLINKDKDAIVQSFEQIKNAIREYESYYVLHQILNYNRILDSKLLNISTSLVRYAEEMKKTKEQRSEVLIKHLRQSILTNYTIDKDLEISKLSLLFYQLREYLGNQHLFVNKLLGYKSPSEFAQLMVNNVTLIDLQVRNKLLESKPEDILSSGDLFIKIALEINQTLELLNNKYEREFLLVVNRNQAFIEQAYLKLNVEERYPNAKMSLRYSYGTLKGYQDRFQSVSPHTFLGEVFLRAEKSGSFNLPPSWLEKKLKINPETPFNFLSTLDSVGGSSGSAVINKNKEIVGLLFDGNKYGAAAEHYFDPQLSRSISLNAVAIVEVLKNIYQTQRILDEIQSKASVLDSSRQD